MLPILLAIHGLLTPHAIIAQEEEEGSALIKIFQTIDQVGQRYRKSQQKKRAASRSSSQAAQYKPRPIPSKYFPQCPVSKGRSNFPENVCRRDLPGSASEAQGVKNVAIQNITFLEALLVEGQESQGRLIGLQCLKEARDKKLSDIQNVINRLTLESIRIKKGVEEFKQQAENTLSEMNKIQDELTGKNNMDFSQEFSPTCQDIFSPQDVGRSQ